MAAPPGLLRPMLDGASEASMVVLSSGAIWHMNEPARQLFQVVLGDRSGASVSTYLSFSTTESLYLSWAEVTRPHAFTDNRRSVEGVGITEGGDRFPVSISLVKVNREVDAQEQARSGQSSASERNHGGDEYHCLYIRAVTHARLQISFLEEEISRLSATNDAMLNASGQHLMVVNNGGFILSVSDGTSQMFGYDQDDSLIGRNVNAIMGENGGHFDLEYMYRRRVNERHNGGSTIDLEVGLARTFTEHTVIMIKNETDIGGLSCEEWNQMVDAAFDPLFFSNKSGIISMVNQAAVDEFGYGKGELIGCNVSMIFAGSHQENNDSYVNAYGERSLKRMIGKQQEIQCLRSDGTEFMAELGLSEVPTGLCGFIRKITKQKTQEKSMLDQKDVIINQTNVIRGILDASFDALFVINDRGIIRDVNETSSRVFGWEREDFIGKNISMIMPRDVAANHDEFLQNYLKTGVKKMMGTQREVTAQRKDMSTFPCVLGLSQAKDSGLFCGFIRDLTAEKAAQAEIARGHNHVSNQKSINGGILDACKYSYCFGITSSNTSMFLSLLAEAFDALFVIDHRGIIQQVNETSSRVFGWEREDFIGKNISMIMPSGVAANHDKFLQNYLKSGVKKMMGTQREVTAQRKDMSTFPCVLGLSQAKDSGLFCGFIRDLTAEKAAQAEIIRGHKHVSDQKNINDGILDASQQSHRFLLDDEAFDALFVINDQGIIQQVNETSSSVFGWEREDFIGKNISMIMPSDVAANHDKFLQNYLKTGVKKMMGTQREVTAQRKDLSTFPCVLGLSQAKDSDLFCGFIRDLTAEKAAEAKIVASYKRVEHILNASFDALFCINDQGIILQVNKASTKVFGWKERELLGKNISMIMPEGHSRKHDTYLANYLRTGFKKMIGKQREVEAKRKDGTCFPCILGLSELDTDGPKQFVGFIKDVTVEKSLLVARAEREASDSLLHNILPESIANRLKQDPSHIADHYENTTILFADIVGFTNKASKMSPHDVVTMLNDLFSRFDYLVDRYEINKVKTIGDCYMVTSIPSGDLEHDGCARVCRFALDLMKAVNALNATGPQHGHIELRVGIACGHVVAGVVGTKRFLFDMWGDAVNVAARMEQHGLPGQIQVTKEVVDNAGSDLRFESRGQLAVKGKGLMDTFLLISAKKESTTRRSSQFQWEPNRKPTPSMRSKSGV